MINIAKQTSILFEKHIKKLPEKLIYYREHDTKYFMFSDKGKLIGRMRGYPDELKPNGFYYPTEKNGYKSFAISALKAFQERIGVGRTFIELAKRESEKFGCSGRVHLDAFNSYDPAKPPQIFYRKLGFTSINKEHIKLIDECIRKNKSLDGFATVTPMYLPIKK